MSKTKYTVKRDGLNHDHVRYDDGDVIELTDREAAPLLTLSPPALEVADDDAEVTLKTPETEQERLAALAAAEEKAAAKTVADAKAAAKKPATKAKAKK